MVRDRYKEASRRKFVARFQRSGKSRGDPLASISSGGVDFSGSHRGQRLLQISRRIRAPVMPTFDIDAVIWILQGIILFKK